MFLQEQDVFTSGDVRLVARWTNWRNAFPVRASGHGDVGTQPLAGAPTKQEPNQEGRGDVGTQQPYQSAFMRTMAPADPPKREDVGTQPLAGAPVQQEPNEELATKRVHSVSNSESGTKRRNAKTLRMQECGRWGLPRNPSFTVE